MSSISINPVFFYAPNGTELSAYDDRKLCLEVGDDHVSYTVSDASGKNIYVFGFYDCQSEDKHDVLEHLLTSEAALQYTYTDVILLCNTPRFVLIPEQIHKEHLSETILETIHGNKEVVTVHADNIYQWEITAVYGIDQALENMVLEKFPQTRKVHFVSPVLRHAFRNMDLTNNQSLTLYFYKEMFLAMVFSGDQLQIIQHFQFQTTEDVLYQILNIVERFRLDVTEMRVNVSGYLDLKSAIWTELKKHFLEISIEDSPVIKDGYSNFPHHYFTPFFMVPTCV